jgi:hypothetical protein
MPNFYSYGFTRSYKQFFLYVKFRNVFFIPDCESKEGKLNNPMSYESRKLNAAFIRVL